MCSRERPCAATATPCRADSLLDLLVAAALSASAKSDFQQASILRVTDPAQRAAIGTLFPGMPWIGVSPVFFVFLGDARRLQRIGELRGKPVRNGTLEGFFNASVDAALAMQTMILCAEFGRSRRLSDQRHSQRDRQGGSHS